LKFYKLENEVKHYPWGDAEFIPKLMKKQSDGKPWAEMWMGVHPKGPSRIAAEKSLLSDVADKDGGLPFLLKFLAAGSPLSIQAHPDKAQAAEGFERENAAGVAFDAPDRNYKDKNHKPEIICALTPFTAMAGFRTIDAIKQSVGLFFSHKGHKAHKGEEEIAERLIKSLDKGHREFLECLFNLSDDERKLITDICVHPCSSAGDNTLCGLLAKEYPDDPGILAPLYLNVVELKPGEGIFLPAGILHAYIRGLGVECMANSDNVLRGGLTKKYVDVADLLRIVKFEPYRPEVFGGCEVAPACFRYPAPVTEFALYRIEAKGGAEFGGRGAAIAACVRGEAALSAGGERTVLAQGESAYIPPRAEGEAVAVSGDATVFVAASQ
jgi:mannose-6-phosphate isomerase